MKIFKHIHLLSHINEIYLNELSESEFLYNPNDLKNMKEEVNLPQNRKLQEKEIKEHLDHQEKLLNENLNLKERDGIPSFDKKDIYDRFLEYISLHLDDYFIDGHLGIEFQIKYFACCFIVVFIPGEIAFFFPEKIFSLIPKRIKRQAYVKDFFDEMKIFFKFLKFECKNKLYVNTFFGRTKAFFEDLEACVYAVRDITKDTERSIRTILDFSVKAKNYGEFKENYQKSKKNKQNK